MLSVCPDFIKMRLLHFSYMISAKTEPEPQVWLSICLASGGEQHDSSAIKLHWVPIMHAHVQSCVNRWHIEDIHARHHRLLGRSHQHRVKLPLKTSLCFKVTFYSEIKGLLQCFGRFTTDWAKWGTLIAGLWCTSCLWSGWLEVSFRTMF